jgi:hypothetical protein
VVLDDRRHDDITRRKAKAVGEVVERLGGVATDDGDVVSFVTPGEGECGVTCVFVSRCGELRLVTGSTVDARIPGDELLHSAKHCRQRSGGGGRVEGEVWSLLAVEAGDERAISHQRDRWARHEFSTQAPLVGTRRRLSSRFSGAASAFGAVLGAQGEASMGDELRTLPTGAMGEDECVDRRV